MNHKLRLHSLILCLTCASAMQAAPEASVVNAFSPMKGKLQAGQDAVLFINGDSTSYTEYGSYYLFAKSLGESTGCTVTLRRWAEWVRSAPTGPKEYAPPVTLHQGDSKAKLEVYLASLPGAVAGAMFDGSRRKNAIEEIPHPDCALLHHGHNMMNYPTAFPGDLSSGRGLFLSVIERTATQWPGVPQAIVTQNPWRDSDQYAKIFNVFRSIAADVPQLTVIDSHQLFIAAGKNPALYHDNIHPADRQGKNAGARMVADALISAWREAKPGAPFSTPNWSQRPAVNLINNGNFSDWDADLPAGWSVGGSATVEKSKPDSSAGQPFALALRPNGNKDSSLFKVLTDAETAAVRGKTITIAALVRGSSAQPRPFATFVCPVEGTNRTFAIGDVYNIKDEWFWLVCSGIPVDAHSPPNSLSLRFLPSLSRTSHTSNDPLLIQRVLLLNGPLPSGLPQ